MREQRWSEEEPFGTIHLQFLDQSEVVAVSGSRLALSSHAVRLQDIVKSVAIQKLGSMLIWEVWLIKAQQRLTSFGKTICLRQMRI